MTPNRIAIAITVLAIHLIIALIPWNQFRIAPSPPLQFNSMSPDQLAQLKKQWTEQNRTDPKSILLSKNQPKSAVEPKDARFISDRNIEVEKEQRARQTQVIPKTGGQAGEENPTEKVVEKRPSIEKLGVPYQLKTANQKPSTRGNSASTGGDQAILDRSLSEGAENMLRAKESVYYSYYARLYEEIGPLWQSMIHRNQRRIPPGEYITQVDVVFNARGELVRIRFIRSSGIPEFERAVEESWKKIKQFPNPPKALLDGSGEIHTGWTFAVQVGAESGFQFMPPERVY